MPQRAEGLLPVRWFLFLFVWRGRDIKVGLAVAGLPCLVSRDLRRHTCLRLGKELALGRIPVSLFASSQR